MRYVSGYGRKGSGRKGDGIDVKVERREEGAVGYDSGIK